MKEKETIFFGCDGVKKESDKLNFKLLGEVPILKEISNSCDKGEPISYESNKIFENVFKNISENFLDSISKINKKNVKIES